MTLGGIPRLGKESKETGDRIGDRNEEHPPDQVQPQAI